MNFVKIKRPETTSVDFPLPAYATPGSSGMDLRAHLPLMYQKEGIRLSPSERLLVSSGFMIEIPANYEGQIRPRSGLALKFGIGLINSPGTIDSDYRGEIKIALINLGTEDFYVRHGERIAQLVIAPVIRVVCKIENKLSDSDRSELGFGSTGDL